MNSALAAPQVSTLVKKVTFLTTHDAEANATAALKLAPGNLQALFRRGLARVELRQWSLARQGKEAIKYLLRPV